MEGEVKVRKFQGKTELFHLRKTTHLYNRTIWYHISSYLLKCG